MRKLACALVALLLLLPVSLQAQACQGSPAARGSAIVVADVAFTDGATAFGPTVGGNFEGPIFAAGTFRYTDVDGTDEALLGVGGLVGAELLTESRVSFCLTGSASHNWVTDVDIDGQVYNGALSVGHSIAADEVFVTPHASVGVTHATANVGIFEGSDTAAQFRGGVSVGSRTVFVGGTVSYATFDDADPVFGVGLGLAF